MVNHSSAKYPFLIQPTSFVGRGHELTRIAELLTDHACRLLTLVGTGGIGKTRLAIEAARQLLPDSARFVELQQLTSPDFLVSAIADALGFQFYPGDDPKQQLLDFLCEKSWLLLLDNFEHLLDGTALLSEILAYAPDIRLLVTSRERLNLVEEWVLEVEGLAYPSENDPEPERYSAIELFVQHARRVKTDFKLTGKNRAAVVRICRLVGGMPLGIELAASWVRALSCAAIAEEIGRSLDILETPARNVEPRHRTMRAAFEPTWTRLSDHEQNVFMKLSVFRGGFTREAAKQVAGTSLHTLSVLLDKSLLRLDESGRYDLHELLRQYAEEHLHESGKVEAVYDDHSRYYADYLDQRIEDLKGRRQFEALKETTPEFENMRRGWTWAVDHRSIDTLNKMMEGVWLFSDLGERYIECKLLFQYAEQRFIDDSHPERERLWGRLCVRIADATEADTNQLEKALQIARRYNDLAEVARCLERLGLAAYHGQDYVIARQLSVQSLKIFRQVGDPYYVAYMLFKLQSASYREGWGDFEQLGLEAYYLRRKISDQHGIAASLSTLAHREARVGHFAEAEHLWLERIALVEEFGAPHLVSTGYAHVSYAVYFVQGDFAKSRAAAETALNIAREHVILSGIKWSLATLGLLASMEERYHDANDLSEKSAAVPGGLAWASDLALFGHCLANCGLEDYSAARTDLSTVLPRIVNIPGLAGSVLCLPVAAILLAHDGDPILAVELLGLAYNHWAHASGWMEKWPLLTRLRVELQGALGAEVYAAAWERGQGLDVDHVATELRERFPGERAASQEKIKPLSANLLTERELEILQFIATGLSNQEIADRLYVGVSTVKKHINHIYDKLDTKNRTQAVARAREQGLLG